MHEVQIDIEQRTSVRTLMDNVLLPKSFKECFRQHLYQLYRVVSLAPDDRRR